MTFDTATGASRFGTAIDISQPAPTLLSVSICNHNKLLETKFSSDVLSQVPNLLNDNITPYEVRRARLSLKLGKASLNLRPEHLRLVECAGIDIGLSTLFNAFWNIGYIPENCRTAKIVAIFKGGNRDASIPTNYKPISICDALAKLYDDILTHRLKHLLAGSLDDRQYGGRRGMGCNLQLIRVAEYLNEMRESERGDTGKADNYVVFLLCDMAKAFDRSAR